ncbi:MerR family transcriptional regulator [Streptomyces sp. GMY02]|uniref:MerR family transcriptional regulator n=1 Tax=Streptomyces sp. GMY02 TaxID=1333528 RepID=UPI001C2C03F2|nr:MerR family transcriptional regulator [Streptomyces sp. GMY02]QXE39010.1 MerR family transcriptional regulator [Streptomyces sp. GMY02]
MNGDALYSIGELARRTGVTVKTIRFYADCGIVPPAGRSPVGHRLYGDDALARLDLVRALRDLGLGLAAIRQVMDRAPVLPEVAAAQVEDLDMQIRVLRLRRAVLTAVAKRRATPEETALMHKLATLSEAERRRLVDDFLDAAFGGVGADREFAGVMCSMTPELPEDPDPEQVQAWVELAELAQDTDFRAHMRLMAEHQAAERAGGVPFVPRGGLVATVRDRVAQAVAAGVDASSPQADPIVSDLMSRCARFLHGEVDGEVEGEDRARARRRLLDRLESMNDPRRERYLRLLAVINGWPAPESLQPALDWTILALRVRVRP